MRIDDEYRIARWVRRGRRRTAVLALMCDRKGPITGSQIGRELDVSLHKVSHSLRELLDRRLVELLDPKRASKRRYQLSRLGRRVHRMIWRDR